MSTLIMIIMIIITIKVWYGTSLSPIHWQLPISPQPLSQPAERPTLLLRERMRNTVNWLDPICSSHCHARPWVRWTSKRVTSSMTLASASQQRLVTTAKALSSFSDCPSLSNVLTASALRVALSNQATPKAICSRICFYSPVFIDLSGMKYRGYIKKKVELFRLIKYNFVLKRKNNLLSVQKPACVWPLPFRSGRDRW